MAFGAIDTAAGINEGVKLSQCASLTVCAFAVGVYIYVCPACVNGVNTLLMEMVPKGGYKGELWFGMLLIDQGGDSQEVNHCLPGLRYSKLKILLSDVKIQHEK